MIERNMDIVEKSINVYIPKKPLKGCMIWFYLYIQSLLNK